MIRLTMQEILALASFDPDTLPSLVRDALGKLMVNYADQLTGNPLGQGARERRVVVRVLRSEEDPSSLDPGLVEDRSL